MYIIYIYIYIYIYVTTAKPTRTLIYLHSFSNKGASYSLATPTANLGTVLRFWISVGLTQTEP